MPDERLTFKEMCARFDVTPRTLRYYEYIELLKPEREAAQPALRPPRHRPDDADPARPALRLQP